MYSEDLTVELRAGRLIAINNSCPFDNSLSFFLPFLAYVLDLSDWLVSLASLVFISPLIMND